jgi:hypothetical protein
MKADFGKSFLLHGVKERDIVKLRKEHAFS